MDGYSVHDAATVLGVPEARVWELIARGVLAGTPEADGGMRVFLKQGTPAEADRPPREPAADAPRANGNGSPHPETPVELSPFRELLTEFRSLTERYGQALLALGEARGEVAGLRTRVELLEARLDLRLPGPRPMSSAAWELPDHVERPRPAAPEVERGESTGPSTMSPARPATASPQTEEPVDGGVASVDMPAPGAEPRRRVATRQRIKGGRSALGGIAEALARAQDPTLEALPGAREAAEALAELQRDAAEPALEAIAREDAADDFAEPPVVAVATPLADLEDDELAASDLEVEPDEPGERPESLIQAPAAPEPSEGRQVQPASPPSPYSTEVVEPDWFADGDFTWLDAAQQSQMPSETEAASEREPELQPEVAAEPEPESGPQIEVATVTDDEHAELHAEAAPAAEAIQGAFEEQPAADLEPPAAGGPAKGIATPDPVTVELPEEEWWPEQDVSARSLPAPEGLPSAGAPLDEAAASELPAATALTADRQAEEELMWLGDEFEEAGLEFATPGWRSEPEESARPSSQPEPSDERAPVLELSDEELSRLARNEGWDLAEVSAIRTFLGRTEPAAVEPPAAEAAVMEPAPEPDADPASAARGVPSEPPPAPQPRPEQSGIPIDTEQELDALARLDRLTQPPRAALRVGAPPAQEAEGQESEAAGDDAGSDGDDADTEDPDQVDPPLAGPPAPEARGGVQAASPRQPGLVDPVWLRGRRGPAATAYRRLRRLFPG